MDFLQIAYSINNKSISQFNAIWFSKTNRAINGIFCFDNTGLKNCFVFYAGPPIKLYGIPTFVYRGIPNSTTAYQIKRIWFFFFLLYLLNVDN